MPGYPRHVLRPIDYRISLPSFPRCAMLVHHEKSVIGSNPVSSITNTMVERISSLTCDVPSIVNAKFDNFPCKIYLCCSWPVLVIPCSLSKQFFRFLRLLLPRLSYLLLLTKEYLWNKYFEKETFDIFYTNMHFTLFIYVIYICYYNAILNMRSHNFNMIINLLLQFSLYKVKMALN